MSQPSDKIFFYSRSKDCAPGKGANEVIQDPSAYSELSKDKQFRKVLSNFHVSPFPFEGYTYQSIEHVFQAKKIELMDPAKAYFFTIESGHEIGLGDGAMAQKNRKLVYLDKPSIAKWEQIKDNIMKAAAIAKYTHCPYALKTLKATQMAQLWHIVPRKPAVRFTHLEEIRTIL